MSTFDVIVAGAGPAGLQAAQTLGRVRRSVLLLDTNQGRNAPAAHMHNFLTRDGTPPAELRAMGRDELARYPTVEVREAGAVAARAVEGGFAVELADGSTTRARRLLLATGLADELPAIDGLAERWGRSVFHCPYCHGFETAGLSVGVLGASEPVVALAFMLTRLAGDVTLFTDGAQPAREVPGITVHRERVQRAEGAGGGLERVLLEDGTEVACDALFLAPVLRQRSPLAEQLGCRRYEDGLVEVDDLGRTSVPGVSAAGDMARRAGQPGPAAAVIAAAASGLVAAAALDKGLLAEELEALEPSTAAA